MATGLANGLSAAIGPGPGLPGGSNGIGGAAAATLNGSGSAGGGGSGASIGSTSGAVGGIAAHGGMANGGGAGGFYAAAGGAGATEAGGAGDGDWAEDDQQMVVVSDVVRRAVALTYRELRELADRLPQMGNEDRNREIVDYLRRSRHRLIQLYVLVRWSPQSGVLSACNAALDSFKRRGTNIHSAEVAMRQIQLELKEATAPLYDLRTARDMLVKGTYTQLPSIIAADARVSTTTGVVGPTEPAAVKEAIHGFIRRRLLVTHLPVGLDRLDIGDGCLTMEVSDKFRLLLTLETMSPLCKWRLLRVDVLQPHTGTAPGRDAAFLKETTVVPSDANLSYLHSLLQHRLTMTATPMLDAFTMMTEFCTLLQLQTLRCQACRHAQGDWGKNVHMNFDWSQHRLDISYWQVLAPTRRYLAGVSISTQFVPVDVTGGLVAPDGQVSQLLPTTQAGCLKVTLVPTPASSIGAGASVGCVLVDEVLKDAALRHRHLLLHLVLVFARCHFPHMWLSFASRSSAAAGGLLAWPRLEYRAAAGVVLVIWMEDHDGALVPRCSLDATALRNAGLVSRLDGLFTSIGDATQHKLQGAVLDSIKAVVAAFEARRVAMCCPASIDEQLEAGWGPRPRHGAARRLSTLFELPKIPTPLPPADSDLCTQYLTAHMFVGAAGAVCKVLGGLRPLLSRCVVQSVTRSTLEALHPTWPSLPLVLDSLMSPTTLTTPGMTGTPAPVTPGIGLGTPGLSAGNWSMLSSGVPMTDGPAAGSSALDAPDAFLSPSDDASFNNFSELATSDHFRIILSSRVSTAPLTVHCSSLMTLSRPVAELTGYVLDCQFTRASARVAFVPDTYRASVAAAKVAAKLSSGAPVLWVSGSAQSRFESRNSTSGRAAVIELPMDVPPHALLMAIYHCQLADMVAVIILPPEPGSRVEYCQPLSPLTLMAIRNWLTIPALRLEGEAAATFRRKAEVHRQVSDGSVPNNWRSSTDKLTNKRVYLSPEGEVLDREAALLKTRVQVRCRFSRSLVLGCGSESIAGSTVDVPVPPEDPWIPDTLGPSLGPVQRLPPDFGSVPATPLGNTAVGGGSMKRKFDHVDGAGGGSGGSGGSGLIESKVDLQPPAPAEQSLDGLRAFQSHLERVVADAHVQGQLIVCEQLLREVGFVVTVADHRATFSMRGTGIEGSMWLENGCWWCNVSVQSQASRILPTERFCCKTNVAGAATRAVMGLCMQHAQLGKALDAATAVAASDMGGLPVAQLDHRTYDGLRWTVPSLTGGEPLWLKLSFEPWGTPGDWSYSLGLVLGNFKVSVCPPLEVIRSGLQAMLSEEGHKPEYVGSAVHVLRLAAQSVAVLSSFVAPIGERNSLSSMSIRMFVRSPVKFRIVLMSHRHALLISIRPHGVQIENDRPAAGHTLDLTSIASAAQIHIDPRLPVSPAFIVIPPASLSNFIHHALRVSGV